MASPCDDCIAGCCRELHILPSGHDVYRLATALQLPPSDFVSLRPREERHDQFKIRLSPDAAVHYRLELRKIEETAGEWSRRCVFLSTLGARGRCGVYHARPVECALYPFTGQSDQVVLLRRRPYCPRDAWEPAPVDEPRNAALLMQKQAEAECFDRVVDDWNAALATHGPATDEEFFAYLLAAYERLATKASRDFTRSRSEVAS
jgi:Fe-S-cluster containining protein